MEEDAFELHLKNRRDLDGQRLGGGGETFQAEGTVGKGRATPLCELEEESSGAHFSSTYTRRVPSGEPARGLEDPLGLSAEPPDQRRKG